MRSVVLQKIVQVVLPVTTVFAVYLLLHGHDEPGGGFIAGLVLTLGLVIHAIAFDARDVRGRLERFVRPAFALGLLLAVASGIPAVLEGRPFLTHTSGSVEGPWGAGATVSTALVFDLGVLMVVVGAMSTALALLGERSR